MQNWAEIHKNLNCTVDVRELISLNDAMDDDELKFGPNGGLVFCMEFLLENMVCEYIQYFLKASYCLPICSKISYLLLKTHFKMKRKFLKNHCKIFTTF